MTKVSAPYNFVPLNSKVFFPPWAHLVNHDVPFKDGLSGQISLKITAETPIFIRGEEEVNEQDPNLKQYRFPKKGDRYFIPGSSIKGEITNVLEIMSFSKLRFFNNEHFSQRDWGNSVIYDKRKFAADKIKGGWLSKTDAGYQIRYSNNEIGRISHIELNKKFNDFAEKYSIEYSHSDEQYSLAKHKYANTGILNEEVLSFKDYTFEEIEIKDNKKLFNFSKNASLKGKIVLTGQSSARKRSIFQNNKNKWINKVTGKGYEFIFWEPNEKLTIHLNDTNGKEHELIRNFFLTYNNHKPKEQTDDWKMWKKQLDSGREVPIFITLKNEENWKNGETEIEHFGLSMLYKLLYKNTIKDLIDNAREKREQHSMHFSTKPDFIETLFGDTENKKLKGRVHFSHAFAENDTAKELGRSLTTTLATPKASFYPFYIEQNFRSKNKVANEFEIEGEKYQTFKDDNGNIAGRKRYPSVKRDAGFFEKNNIYNDDNNGKTTTSFIPLKDGAVFSTKIQFHNILPEELGGLLSALTFHGNSETHNHSIGQGKPLGLGSVNITVKTLTIDNITKTHNINKYLCAFETAIEQEIENWHKQEQIKELLALTAPISETKNQLEYLKIIPEQKRNEFADIKRLKKERNSPATEIPQALPRYSIFMNIPDKNTTLISKKDEGCGQANTYHSISEYQQAYSNVVSNSISKLQNNISEIETQLNNLKDTQANNQKDTKEFKTATNKLKMENTQQKTEVADSGKKKSILNKFMSTPILLVLAGILFATALYMVHNIHQDNKTIKKELNSKEYTLCDEINSLEKRIKQESFKADSLYKPNLLQLNERVLNIRQELAEFKKKEENKISGLYIDQIKYWVAVIALITTIIVIFGLDSFIGDKLKEMVTEKVSIKVEEEAPGIVTKVVPEKVKQEVAKVVPEQVKQEVAERVSKLTDEDVEFIKLNLIEFQKHVNLKRDSKIVVVNETGTELPNSFKKIINLFPNNSYINITNLSDILDEDNLTKLRAAKLVIIENQAYSNIWNITTTREFRIYDSYTLETKKELENVNKEIEAKNAIPMENIKTLKTLAEEICKQTPLIYYGGGHLQTPKDDAIQENITFANVPSQLYGNMLNMLNFKLETSNTKQNS